MSAAVSSSQRLFCASCARFPVMLVASCFPAFDLPYLSYSTVFMIGLVVYWLVAVARVERAGVSGSQEG